MVAVGLSGTRTAGAELDRRTSVRYSVRMPAYVSAVSTTKVLEAVRVLGRPTVREIGAKAGLRSPSTVWAALEILRDQGRVTWESGKARTIRIVE